MSTAIEDAMKGAEEKTAMLRKALAERAISPAPEPVAWQKRFRDEEGHDDFPWQNCPTSEAANPADRLGHYEYRALYATPQPGLQAEVEASATEFGIIIDELLAAAKVADADLAAERTRAETAEAEVHRLKWQATLGARALIALRARVGELEAALEPFAEIYPIHPQQTHRTVDVELFRRARALLTKEPS